jgi:hypothetical protein
MSFLQISQYILFPTQPRPEARCITHKIGLFLAQRLFVGAPYAFIDFGFPKTSKQRLSSFTRPTIMLNQTVAESGANTSL